VGRVEAATTSLPLATGVSLVLTPRGEGGWSCDLEPADAPGAAEHLVGKLRDGRSLTQPGFRLQRFAVPPEAAGERPIDADQSNRSVVVGERIVVKWLRHVADAVHAAPQTLAHLAEVGYPGMPKSYGVLLWRAPSGREVPCGIASAYLPGARDGYVWCVELATAAIAGSREEWPATFPAKLGRLTAGLHAALATPSGVLPASVGLADAGRLRRWHATARELLDLAVAAAPGLDAAPAGPDGAGPPPVAPSAALAAARDRLAAAIDLLPDRGTTPVQHVHGDLHVGQVLRWSGGLAVCDFDGDPLAGDLSGDIRARAGSGDRADLAAADLSVQPAARDVAHLLVSLDQVGRIVDRQQGFAVTDAVDAWSAEAREQFLEAYVGELRTLGRGDLFEERLIAPFVAERVCRDVLYADRYLPRWAYAVTGGLHALVP
jgi:maltokinase